MLLGTVVRGDLMQNWRASLPPDAPNQFLINVLPDQVDDARKLLAAAIHTEPVSSRMVRGRLVEVTAHRRHHPVQGFESTAAR